MDPFPIYRYVTPCWLTDRAVERLAHNAPHKYPKRKKRSRTRDYDSKLSTVLLPIDRCLERNWNDAEAELSQFGARFVKTF